MRTVYCAEEDEGSGGGDELGVGAGGVGRAMP